MTALRALFTFAGGLGHLDPMAPLVRGLVERGFEVALAGEQAALRHAPRVARQFAYLSEVVTAVAPLVRPDLIAELQVIGDHFAGRLALQNLGRVTDAIADFRPDMVVSDEMDFGAIAAAERAGLPHATVKVIASGALSRPAFVREPLARLRAAAGLAAADDLVWLEGDLTVVPFPRSFRDPDYPLTASALSMRPNTGGARPDPNDAADWLADAGAGHRVYFTLGTVFNAESGDLFGRVIDGLRRLPVRVLVTVGQNLDPEDIGMRASNVRIERFVPQHAVLPVSDLVVNHAGSGSVIGALASGVPLLVFPMGADQELNAARIAALGVGRILDPVTASPDDIARAADAALHDQHVALAAQAMRSEIRALPEPSTVVDALEQLLR